MRPLRDIIFVERDEPESKVGSIEIPHQARQKATRCRVVAAGPGEYDKRGNRLPMAVGVGDIVHVHTWKGEEVEQGGRTLYALHEDEVEAIEV